MSRLVADGGAMEWRGTRGDGMWDESQISAMIAKNDKVGLSAFIASGSAGSFDSFALRLAALDGLADWVEKLLPHSDPSAWDGAALGAAATDGHLECARLLLPASETRHVAEAFKSAALMGQAEMIRLLGPSADPMGLGMGALALAVDSGDGDALSAALEFCDPAEQKCEALKKALAGRKGAMVSKLAAALDKEGPHWSEALSAAIKGDSEDVLRMGIARMDKGSPLRQDAFKVAVEAGSPKALAMLADGIDVDGASYWRWPMFKHDGRAKKIDKVVSEGRDACFEMLQDRSPSLPREEAFELAWSWRWPKSVLKIASESGGTPLLDKLVKMEAHLRGVSGLAVPSAAVQEALSQGVGAAKASVERSAIEGELAAYEEARASSSPASAPMRL